MGTALTGHSAKENAGLIANAKDARQPNMPEGMERTRRRRAGFLHPRVQRSRGGEKERDDPKPEGVSETGEVGQP